MARIVGWCLDGGDLDGLAYCDEYCMEEGKRLTYVEGRTVIVALAVLWRHDGSDI